MRSIFLFFKSEFGWTNNLMTTGSRFICDGTLIAYI